MIVGVNKNTHGKGQTFQSGMQKSIRHSSKASKEPEDTAQCDKLWERE